MKKLKDEGVSEERVDFIQKFNDYARSNNHALMPVTRYSVELEKALDLHEHDDYEDLFDLVKEGVRTFDGARNKRLTLVRITWNHY